MQAVAYIVRPNALTMDAIRRLRLDPSLHRTFYSGEEQQGRPIPYPLPRGTISMHVRWATLLLLDSAAVMTCRVQACEILVPARIEHSSHAVAPWKPTQVWPCAGMATRGAR